jgi:acyl-homoserine lactone synthase
MLHIVTSANIHLYESEMRKAYQLRHRVFVEEMKWTNLDRGDGLEIDQFDTETAVHMLYLDDNRDVLGYQRMLPTTGPHLLTDALPELCDLPSPVGENIWEWTRYAVHPLHRDRGRKISPIALSLLTGIVEWGLAREIDTLILLMNPIWLLKLVQGHFRITPLGFPKKIGDEDTIAVMASFNRMTLARLREYRGVDSSVFHHSAQVKLAAGRR